MSFLGSMFSGASGAGPQRASIDTPATVAQANEQYGNVQTGLQNQAAFLQAIQAQNGLANQSQVFQQQQQLANTLQAQAAGQGPNPAQAQLAQNTAANTSNQAALMAGQRGTSQNAGLMARQAGMVGANNQQQMAGQQATMQAQQQLAAQQALMQQQNNMQGVAGNQVGNEANATNAYSGAAQNALNSVYQQINNQNQARIGNQSQYNTALGNYNNANNSIGMGFLSGMSSATSSMGSMMGGGAGGAGGASTVAGGPMDAMGGAAGPAMMMAAKGGMAPAPGPRSMAGRHLSSGGAIPMQAGGHVPGQASVQGDSYANDTVPAMLSPGEIVIPRHITQGPDAPAKAAAFVQALLAKQGLKK